MTNDDAGDLLTQPDEWFHDTFPDGRGFGRWVSESGYLPRAPLRDDPPGLQAAYATQVEGDPVAAWDRLDATQQVQTQHDYLAWMLSGGDRPAPDHDGDPPLVAEEANLTTAAGFDVDELLFPSLELADDAASGAASGDEPLPGLEPEYEDEEDESETETEAPPAEAAAPHGGAKYEPGHTGEPEAAILANWESSDFDSWFKRYVVESPPWTDERGAIYREPGTGTELQSALNALERIGIGRRSPDAAESAADRYSTAEFERLSPAAKAEFFRGWHQRYGYRPVLTPAPDTVDIDGRVMFGGGGIHMLGMTIPRGVILAVAAAAVIAVLAMVALSGGGDNGSEVPAGSGGSGADEGATSTAPAGGTTAPAATNSCQAARDQQLVLDLASPGDAEPAIPLKYTRGEASENGFPTPYLEWSELPPETTEIAILVQRLTRARGEEYAANTELWWTANPSGIVVWQVTGLDRSLLALPASSQVAPLPEGAVERMHENGRLTLGDEVYEQKFWINTGEPHLFTVFALCDPPLAGTADDYNQPWLIRNAVAVGWFISSLEQ